jgi:hypothetical protein
MLFGWSGENGLGSLGWSQDNVQAPAAPVQINTGPGGFNGIVLQPYAIPEPSVFALAGLGAAALLISRRRK